MSLSRKNNFDFLRLFAAFLVFFDHMFGISGRAGLTIVPYVNPGRVGVWIFFVVSGYLITQSWMFDRHPLRFAIKRILRVWPALIVMVLLSVFVLGPLATHLTLEQYFDHPQTFDFFLILQLEIRYILPGVFDEMPLNAVNGPLWTIPIEVKCYFVLLVLGICQVINHRVLMPLLLTGLLSCFFVDFYAPSRLSLDAVTRSSIELGAFFCFGSCLYTFQSLLHLHARVLVLAIGIMGFVGYELQQYLLISFLMLPPLVILFGTACTPVIHRAGRWGDFSYGLYIYAWPVQQLMTMWLGERVSFVPLLVLTYLVVLLFAAASWYGVESRMLRLKPKSNERSL